MSCTPLGTTTPNLGLCKPAAGEQGWTDGINGNWDILDQGLSVGVYAARNLVGQSDPTTPDTKFGASADLVVLRNPITGALLTKGPVTTRTCDLTTVGFGGLDSGAIAANTWYYFYFVWSSAVSLMASILTPAQGGPVMPAGGTHWAFVAAIRTDSLSHLLKTVRLRGSWMSYDGPPTVLAGGASTSPAPVDVSGFVPPNALQYEVTDVFNQAGTASGGIAMRLDLSITSGTPMYKSEMTLPTLSGAVRWSIGARTMPNIGQQFSYQWTVSTGSNPVANLAISRYQISNGGE